MSGPQDLDQKPSTPDGAAQSKRPATTSLDARPKGGGANKLYDDSPKGGGANKIYDGSPKTGAQAKLAYQSPDQQGSTEITNAVQQAVDVAETQVSQLSEHVLYGPLGQLALTNAATAISAAMTQAQLAIDMNKAYVPELKPQIDRLGQSIALLFSRARRHQMPMRETNLENVFDQEDNLRNAAGANPAGRAILYYDGNLVPIRHEGNAPDAAAVTGQLVDPAAAGGQPQTRDQLVSTIASFGDSLKEAIKKGFEDAARIIRRPDPAEDPSLLVQLAETAAEVFISMATAGLGQLLGAAFKLLDSKVALAEHVGEQISDLLMDGFKEGGQAMVNLGFEAATAGSTPAAAEHGDEDTKEHGPKPGSQDPSPSGMFLDASAQKQAHALTKMGDKYVLIEATLKRLPIDALQQIKANLSYDVTDRANANTRDQLIREWVNFSRVALAKGQEVRAPEQRKASKLDEGNYGVVRVQFTYSGGEASFKRASMPQLSKAVVDNLRQQQRTLANLGFPLTVDFYLSNIPLQFGVTEKGGITDLDVASMSPEIQVMCANFGKHAPETDLNYSTVLFGLTAFVQRLAAIPSSAIEARE